MLGYALDMLPIIRQLKDEFPEVEQTWYADNAAAASEFARIRTMFERLLDFGLGREQFFVAVRHNLERAKVYFADLAFKVQTRSRYL
jgi:hypothetical protein